MIKDISLNIAYFVASSWHNQRNCGKKKNKYTNKIEYILRTRLEKYRLIILDTFIAHSKYNIVLVLNKTTK